MTARPHTPPPSRGRNSPVAPRAGGLLPAGLLLAGLLLAGLLLWGACGRSTAEQSTPSATADTPALADEELAVVGFYNVENLFDVDDDPDNRGDDEFLPTAAKAWTAKRYQAKLARLAGVVRDIGAEAAAGGPAILGVAEVENARVLHDLVAQPALAGSRYAVIHFESPDSRGIDVGLIYREALFTPLSSRPLRVRLPSDAADTTRERTTRDVLFVRGLLGGDTVSVFVNHWPSRRGGEAASRPGRAAAAAVVRQAVDSLQARQPNEDILIVGDLNDDPTDASLTKTLRAVDRRADAGQTGLYNPMVALFRRGEGSLGYRDSWNLFDQIVVSSGLARASDDWSLRDARVYRRGELLQPAGRYKGYPLRTFAGDSYIGGYSDHLPAYAVLTRPRRS